MTVKTKLLISYALVCLMVLGISVLSLSALSSDDESFRDYVEGINAREALHESVLNRPGFLGGCLV